LRGGAESAKRRGGVVEEGGVFSPFLILPFLKGAPILMVEGFFLYKKTDGHHLQNYP